MFEMEKGDDFPDSPFKKEYLDLVKYEDELYIYKNLKEKEKIKNTEMENFKKN
jgi:hypothetical protein